MSISATTRGLRPGVCTSTTRPASPFDGQLIYETDSNLLRVWNGSAWKTLSYSDATNGTVLQVAQTTKTDTWTQSNSGGGDFDVTGLSVSITPNSSTSKVLILASISKGTYGSPVIKRGSTTLIVGDTAGSRTVVPMSGISSSESNCPLTISYTYLDSPATTSSTTYKISMRDNHSPVATTMYINRGNTDNNEIYSYRATSTLTVMEVAA
jgi:hypothetical protein